MAHMASIFSFSFTGNRYSKLSPDQVIEMTMNKHSKNRRGGGWVGFTKNLSMIAVNVLSRPAVLYLREQLLQAVHMKKPLYRHPELGPSRIKKDLEVVHNVQLALQEWDADPWDLSRPNLCSLCTGRPATEEYNRSLNTAHDEKNLMAEDFLDRLSSGTRSLHYPIIKRKSTTFATKTVSRERSKKDMRTLADHAATKQIVDFLISGENPTMTLRAVMQYRITTVPLSLFMPEGMFDKPLKSKFITLMPVMPPPFYHAVIDVGMAWNKVPACKTWGEYACTLYKFILSRHPHAAAFHLMNDVYSEEALRGSTKLQEQKRRMQTYGFLPNVYLFSDQKMPSGSAWRSFLSKPENKERLQQFLLLEWLSYDHNADWYFTKDNRSHDLTSGKWDPRFEVPSPREADTRAFFHAAQLDESPIVFYFEDTDVWVVASYNSHHTDRDMYMYKKKSGNAEFYSCRSLF
jgi:hypothetical protein